MKKELNYKIYKKILNDFLNGKKPRYLDFNTTDFMLEVYDATKHHNSKEDNAKFVWLRDIFLSQAAENRWKMEQNEKKLGLTGSRCERRELLTEEEKIFDRRLKNRMIEIYYAINKRPNVIKYHTYIHKKHFEGWRGIEILQMIKHQFYNLKSITIAIHCNKIFLR